MADQLKISLKKNNPVHTWSIQGRKPAQEDSYFVSEKIIDKQLIFVADGVGGHGHGDFASQLCVEIFKNSFNSFNQFRNIPSFLKKTVLVVAASILNKGVEDPEFKNCGTTFSGFFIDSNEYYFMNIGDSRVYHYSTNNLKRVSKDHSIVQTMIDEGLLTEDEAFVHPKRNMMTSALGQSIDQMKVDIYGPFPVEEGELLLAFSDGVHDALKDPEIKALIEKNLKSENLAKVLVEASYDAGGKDNITACVYRHSK
jgi:PPM family protein phosphatase